METKVGNELSVFFSQIDKFNKMYKLNRPLSPTLPPVEAIEAFHQILKEEVDEGVDLIASLKNAQEPREYVLAELADWLGDIMVYCASEGRKWGLPMATILHTIMESNFSKLGEDGEPIYDERGKVLKGPRYWKPEPKLREILGEMAEESNLSP